MLLLHAGLAARRAGARGARGRAAGAEVGPPDELGVFEIALEADDLEQALERVWDGVAASGSDDHIVFLEHPELPEHWRAPQRAPAVAAAF